MQTRAGSPRGEDGGRVDKKNNRIEPENYSGDPVLLNNLRIEERK
jgi:hypothetical protein